MVGRKEGGGSVKWEGVGSWQEECEWERGQREGGSRGRREDTNERREWKGGEGNKYGEKGVEGGEGALSSRRKEEGREGAREEGRGKGGEKEQGRGEGAREEGVGQRACPTKGSSVVPL